MSMNLMVGAVVAGAVAEGVGVVVGLAGPAPGAVCWAIAAEARRDAAVAARIVIFLMSSST
ncbi:hypothetical protein [Xanthobacter sp. KR7-225]|uniref:hypothetical protein n=1 Tax=Xanthobacter sp. KR7-225 TaxID=3156613 RepID=UPI0032B56BEA